MKSKEITTRQSLGRSEWIEAATSALAERGVDGMRVEVLAKTCGVTKGSFYWHFKDRQELCNAVLEHWKTGRLRDIDKQSVTPPGTEREVLRRIIDLYGAKPNQRGMAIELAVRDWARRDEKAASVVAGVDAYRLERARQLFVTSGMPDAEARGRSLLLYAYVFGLSLMAGGGSDLYLDEDRKWIGEQIVAD